MASRPAQRLNLLKKQALVEGTVPPKAIQKRKRTVILPLLIQNKREPQSRCLNHRPAQPGILFGKQPFQEVATGFSHQADSREIQDSRADGFIARIALAKAPKHGRRRCHAAGVLAPDRGIPSESRVSSALFSRSSLEKWRP